MYSVKLLALLLSVLSVCSIAAAASSAAQQAPACPSSGMVCSPGDCCGKYQLCWGTTFWPVQATAAGTDCMAGSIVLSSACAGIQCASSPSGGSQPTQAAVPTQAPAPTAAPTTAAPAPAAPAPPQPTPSPSQQQATAAPTWWSPPANQPTWWSPPATQAPTPAPTWWSPPKATPAPAQQATSAPTPVATQAPTPAPTSAPTLAPTPAPTSAPSPANTVAPPASGATSRPLNGNGANTFGQILMGYYSGVSLETVGSGGLNALAMAFFDPTPLGANTNCDFTDSNTNCIMPAAGSGGSKNLAWALNVFKVATPLLKPNTSPVKNGKPTIYFSFGGQSQGGACWDDIFGNAAKAQLFGQNAAKLVTTVYNTIGQSAYVGFDLDIEGTTTALPYMGTFMKAFRAAAPYSTFPLQLCSLSGLSDPSNDDYFKIGIMQQFGPSTQGINFLNMMVANVDESCTDMLAYWMHPSLSFIPAANKIFGMWGELLPSWILHEPGCTTGGNPLFPFMQRSGAGIGIWQWWAGDYSNVLSVLSQVRPN